MFLFALFNMLLWLSPPPGAGGDSPSPFIQFVPIVLIFVVFYFFMIRPQQKKQKDREKVLDSLKKGDKVVTIGGLHGKVAGLDADKKTVLVQVDNNLKLTFDRAAIATIDQQESGEKIEAAQP